jgi:hypothetical protein
VTGRATLAIADWLGIRGVAPALGLPGHRLRAPDPAKNIRAGGVRHSAVKSGRGWRRAAFAATSGALLCQVSHLSQGEIMEVDLPEVRVGRFLEGAASSA